MVRRTCRTGKGRCEGQRPKDETREVQRGEFGIDIGGDFSLSIGYCILAIVRIAWLIGEGNLGIMRFWLGGGGRGVVRRKMNGEKKSFKEEGEGGGGE